jgi:predicted DNA binding CopG/RHH family protein
MSSKTQLDNYEQDIENHIEKSKPIKGLQEEMDLIQATAKRHMTRKKSITLRIHELDLEAIKIIASKNGVPYQTYLNIIIHREASHFLK